MPVQSSSTSNRIIVIGTENAGSNPVTGIFKEFMNCPRCKKEIGNGGALARHDN